MQHGVLLIETELHEIYLAPCKEVTWHPGPHSGPTPHSGSRFQRSGAERSRKMIICVIALFAAAKVGHKFGGTKTVRCRCWGHRLQIGQEQGFWNKKDFIIYEHSWQYRHPHSAYHIHATSLLTYRLLCPRTHWNWSGGRGGRRLCSKARE